MSDAEEITITPFNELKRSTMTVMSFSNMDFDLNRLFTELPIYHVPQEEIPNVKDWKKRIRVPFGHIFVAKNRAGNIYRGAKPYDKPKRCVECYPEEEEEKKKGKTFPKTVFEKRTPSQVISDGFCVTYHCSECGNIYDPSKIKPN